MTTLWLILLLTGLPEAGERALCASAPRLRILALLPDPVDVPDRDGEWLLLGNPAPFPVPLGGVAVAVGGTVRCVLPPGVVLPPFGEVRVGRRPQPGLLPCRGLLLPNRHGHVALLRGADVLDAVAWARASPGEELPDVSGKGRRPRSSPRRRG
ncbi:MAG: hypothetical protein FJ098_01495 [Deltaproteobacteria bacterium]|nr:hypothetical protein [Deltaproteobacteria bacterium]